MDLFIDTLDVSYNTINLPKYVKVQWKFTPSTTTRAIFNSLKTIVLSNELSQLNTKSDHFEVYFLMSMMRPEDACTHSQYASSVNFLNIIIIASRSIVHSHQSNSNALGALMVPNVGSAGIYIRIMTENCFI
ncbi:unnamed protein product [Ambrosiozyma monospora]|uniref:Unnamed protein product n=1 Tax=Ambrosiozyma monospora TaxID=43982 RepID=A0ACB5SRF2_AMBMO|nr:unnamed protein product [Ambrosiozyma monospora]